ncbi:hypothetical protein jhhlp_001561 [Lomentospora prolificans]|uniref:INO80 complex subunit B-like conserved region domain-containing protein n=1 Tax=Lomentospora prolificans TaxID=41688 RepID=A0A2N3NIM4_9PEZI|nr:hypothetical protein jhhlp_001561 [Lomentospora prolificans]
MTGRPRRSAALRANEAITDMAEANDRPMSSRSDRRSGRTSGATVSREPPSSPDHLNLNIKVSSNKLRQATVGRDGVRTEQQISVNSRDSFSGSQIAAGKRNRGGRKNYVVDSDSDEEEDAEMEEDEDESAEHDDDEEEEEEEEEDEDMDGLGEEDADGEADGMELDADGDADGDADDDLGDGEGDVDMDVSITVGRSSKPAPKAKPAPRVSAPKPAPVYEDDDDDDLSDPGPSDIEETITYGETMLGGGDEEDEDAEGEEEIEVAAEEDEEQDGEGDDDDGELDSDEEGGGSGAEAPDLSKMTRRQRARFEDTPTEYMKLSDEVQVKKHFTAEEHAMRRAEMARRRRNLSEKRTEEVKVRLRGGPASSPPPLSPTSNFLLRPRTNAKCLGTTPSLDGNHQQAPQETSPKTNCRTNPVTGAQEDDGPGPEHPKPDPTTFRWVSDRAGSRVALPDELLASQAGNVFRTGGLRSGKMVEEVQ